MTNDDYRALAKEARDALRDVIKASEPGTGMVLHSAYTCLKHMLEPEPETTVSTESDAHKEWWRRHHEQRARWTKLSMPERNRLTLELLGEDRLTVREVMDRLRGELGESAVSDVDARGVLKRLLDAEEVHRKLDPNSGGTVRYRYFRNTQLLGPIVDLERTFHEQDEQEGGE